MFNSEDELFDTLDELDDEDRYSECEECGYEMRHCACIQFQNPGGNSALRLATRDNPRNLPCPTCERPNKLTPADIIAGYQCDSCADNAESGY